MDEELVGWQQAIKLMEEAARIGKEDYVHLHSGSYSRKLLYFLYEQDAFRPTKYNGYDGYNDYLFLLDMFTEDSVRKRRRENAKLSSCNPSTHG